MAPRCSSGSRGARPKDAHGGGVPAVDPDVTSEREALRPNYGDKHPSILQLLNS